MTLQQIKDAVDNNVIVHWRSDFYVVLKDGVKYNILCLGNNNLVGLTFKSDNNKCTQDLKDFYICPMDCQYFKDITELD